MTKFITVAFAVAAFGASLSPAFAGPQGEPAVHDATLVNTYAAAPALASTPAAGTYHYTDAEAAIINLSNHQH